MKRILILVLAAAMFLSTAAVSSADGIDVKVQGQWDFAFGWAINDAFRNNVNRKSPRDNDDFIARQRIRTQVNFITSEYLQGVLAFEIGTQDWGRGGSSGRGSGGALDADGVNIETRRAYLDWIIPNTEISVRMGIQGIKLPSGPMGSPMWDADVAGIVVSSPITDWLSATVFWVRPFDAYYNDTESGTNRHLDDEVDLFALLLPMSGDGWAFTPWGIWGSVGSASGMYDYLFFNAYPPNTVDSENSRATAWWGGAHFELSLFDPLIFNIDGAYGRINQNNLHGFQNLGAIGNWGTKGWYIGATLDYKLDWATPGLFGWYASGDKESDVDDGWLGRLPALGADGGAFHPTSFGFGGSTTVGVGTDSLIATTGSGHWGIGLQLKDFSFIEDLSHTIRVAYYRGTNDEDVIRNFGSINRGFMRYAAHDQMYLTKKDSVWEVNFDHQYKIYENLTMVVELGWLRLDSDEDVWGRAWTRTGGNKEHSNAWKAQVMFKYEF